MAQSPKAGNRTREQLKALMIEAGKEVLVELEPTMGFENLTYTSVFAHLLETRGEKVTVGSVHERIWPAQRDFQLEVLAEALRSVPQDGFNATSPAVLGWFEHADVTTLAGRRYAAQNTSRLFGNLSWGTGKPVDARDAIAHDARFRLWTLGQENTEAAQIHSLVKAHRDKTSQLYSDSLQLLMAAIGLRERAHVQGIGADMVSVLSNGITIGLLTDTLPIAREPHQLPTGPNGELETWQAAALGLWAGVQSLLELDGDDLTDDERRL